MNDRIFTDIEPLRNVLRGLVELRDHIGPIMQWLRKIIAEYDCEIEQSLNALQSDERSGERETVDRTRRRIAELRDGRAAYVKYANARDAFLKALNAFCEMEDASTHNGVGMLNQSILTLERYIGAGSGGNSAYGYGASSTAQKAADSSEAWQERLKVLRLSTDEVSARRTQSIRNIDALVENCREGLRLRGVPEGEWMDRELAKRRAAMLEQADYDLDIASGHGHDTVHSPDAYHYSANSEELYDALAEMYRNSCFGEPSNVEYSEDTKGRRR